MVVVLVRSNAEDHQCSAKIACKSVISCLYSAKRVVERLRECGTDVAIDHRTADGDAGVRGTWPDGRVPWRHQGATGSRCLRRGWRDPRGGWGVWVWQECPRLVCARPHSSQRARQWG